MHLILISDWRYDETVHLQAEAVVQYVFNLASEGQVDQLVLLGNMVPPMQPAPREVISAQVLHLVKTIDPLFNEETGLFSRLIHAGIPVRMLPGATEVTWPVAGLMPAVGLVDYVDRAFILAPEPTGAEPFFVLTSAEERGAGDFDAPNWIAKFAARALGVRGAPLAQAEQAWRLREPAQERRAAQLQSRAPELLLGVIHSGTEPAFGRYGHIWSGCPGGPDWCIKLDTERPDCSELLPLERI